MAARRVLLLVFVCALMGLPTMTAAKDEATPAPSWHPNEQIPSLEAAIAFRESHGLRADPEYVAWSLADPAAFLNMAWSVPLSPEETADMRARLEVQEQLGRVIPSRAKGYAGTYIDQRRGGIPIYLFTEVPENVRAWIARHMSGIEYEVRMVEHTLEELTALKESISAAREDLAAEGIELVSASVHVTENRVEVGVIEATDEARARLAQFGGPVVIVERPSVLEVTPPPSPFRSLWKPLDAGDLELRYYCDATFFTAADLVSAVPADAVEPSLRGSIHGHGRSLLEGDGDWYVVKRGDGRVLALAIDGRRVDSMGFERWKTETFFADTWDFVRGGSCEPQAAFGRGIGGDWRLDPDYPPPGPRARRLHVIGNAGCNGTERRGKARIHYTKDALLIAIPMGSKVHSDMCHGLGPKRMTITLPKPLGDRALYDVGSLPIRQVYGRSID